MSRLPRPLVATVVLLLTAALAGTTGAPAVARVAEVTASGQAATTPLVPEAATSGAAGSRPNVLVIETDDMRADDLRFMPQVRRLVQVRGLTFTSSFAPNPLCCPSRASFLTGRYSHNHGVLSHVPPYGFASFDDRRTLATSLRSAGYRTAMVGKYLNGYGFQRLRSHHRNPGRSSLHYVPPGWTRWMGTLDGGVEERARTTGGRGGTYQYFRVGQNVDGRTKTTSGYTSVVTGTQVDGLMSSFGKGSQPWFLWWTPVAPHHGLPNEPDDPRGVRNAAGKRVELLTPARPTWAKGTQDRLLPRAPGVRRNGTTEADVSDKPRWMRSNELTSSERTGVRELARQRAEALTALDRQVGRTLTKLYRTPQGRRTMVVFTSDNGYYLGEHRVRQGKASLLEPAVRVPLLVAGPGVPKGVRQDPVANIDLAPTIAAYAGARMSNVDGVDLGPVIRGGDTGWTRPIVTEVAKSLAGRADPTVPSSPLTIRGLRLGAWTLNRYSTGEVELYDLRNDPLQLENLANRPEGAEMRARLLALLTQYADCAGAACSAPLPDDLQLTPAEVREVNTEQDRATRSYYG